MREIIIAGETVAVVSAVAPGRRAATGIEWSPAEVVVMLPNEDLISYIEDNSSSEPAVDTAFVPFTWSLTVSASVCRADCLKPDK